MFFVFCFTHLVSCFSPQFACDRGDHLQSSKTIPIMITPHRADQPGPCTGVQLRHQALGVPGWFSGATPLPQSARYLRNTDVRRVCMCVCVCLSATSTYYGCLCSGCIRGQMWPLLTMVVSLDRETFCGLNWWSSRRIHCDARVNRTGRNSTVTRRR